jgi:integrase
MASLANDPNGRRRIQFVAADGKRKTLRWLKTQNLAPATRAKRLRFARTFFHTARKHQIVASNPFAEVKIPPASVRERQHFVERATFERGLAVADPTWRTILVLARLGGLRCPSEVLSLQWSQVDWDAGRLTVVSPKTERYAGKESRVLPLFADLRSHLEAARPTAGEQTHVVGGGHLAKAQRATGWKGCNLRTALSKLLKRAGVMPWPRLFHNLRSSCETELLDRFPHHAVARWMGHEVKVSLKHYAQVTDEHFAQATRPRTPPESRRTRGAKAGAASGGNDKCGGETVATK